MAIVTILVHCDAGRTTEDRAAVAFDLAERHSAHVIGLFVRESFQALTLVEGMPGLAAVQQGYATASKAEEEEARRRFTEVANRAKPTSEWRVAEGPIDEVLPREAHFADLLVVSQGERGPMPPTSLSTLAENLAMVSERPLLVVPLAGAGRTLGSKVLVCWNGSREAARAATGALPILQAAAQVTVLVVDPKNQDAGDRIEPGSDFMGWLARHGVTARIERETASSYQVAETILAKAAALEADLVVMGIYGHSRLRETVLGGASRAMLARTTLPLLIAH